MPQNRRQKISQKQEFAGLNRRVIKEIDEAQKEGTSQNIFSRGKRRKEIVK